MPYVSPIEALGEAIVDLDAERKRMGDAPWRIALVGTPRLRVVLLSWPAGFASVPHYHPHADEIFVPLEGRAIFLIGAEPEREVGPGAFLVAVRGVRHAIRVPEGQDLLLLAAVAPNEDVPSETVE